MLVDWKVEQQMVLKKHPNYFKKGLPYVDEVVLRTIPDEANIVAALRTGQIHHAFIEDNKNYNLLKDEKALTGYRSSRLGLRLPQHQRDPRAAQGRPRAPGDQLRGRPRARSCGWPPPASGG